MAVKNWHFGSYQDIGEPIIHPFPADMFLRYDPQHLPMVRRTDREDSFAKPQDGVRRSAF